jgi:hypothetical protein
VSFSTGLETATIRQDLTARQDLIALVQVPGVTQATPLRGTSGTVDVGFSFKDISDDLTA